MIFFNIRNLLLLSFILFIVIIIVKRYTQYIYPRPTIKDVSNLKKDFPIIQKYIDRYYITNIVYTIFYAMLYLFSTLFIFIIVRYLTLGEISNLLKVDPKDISSYIVILLIIKGIIFVLMLYLYRKLIEILFYQSLLHLHIYLHRNKFYSFLIKSIALYTGEYILKHLWILCYRIATKTYNPDLFDQEFSKWYYQMIVSDEHNYIIKNDFIKNGAHWFSLLSHKYIIVSKVFYLLAYILKNILWHLDQKRFRLTHYTFLLLTALYDIYYHEIYSIYYASFIFLLLRCMITYFTFIRESKVSITTSIMKYFYENTLPYNEQRFYILNHVDYTLNKTSNVNKQLYNIIDFNPNVLFIIFNDFKVYNQENFESDIRRKRYTSLMNLRLHTTFVFFILGIFLLLKSNLSVTLFNVNEIINLPLCFMLTPLAIMLYSNSKIYKCIIIDEYTTEESYEFIYNKKYNSLYWIMVVLQGYIFWHTLIKPEIFFMYNEELFNNIIIITRTFTIEEKIMYLYQYFDYYIQSTGLTIEEQDLLRYKLRQVNFQEIIKEITTLKDIKYNLRYWIAEEYYKNHVDIIERIMRLYTEKQNPWYDLLRNTLVISGISTGILKTISYYNYFLTVLEQLQDPYGRYMVGQDVLSMCSNHINRYRWSIYIHRIFENKLPSILDIILYYGLEYIPLQIRIILMSIIFGLVGTYFLPGFIHYFEKPLIHEIKVYVTFLEDMSTIPIIAPYNCYYFIAAAVIVIFISTFLLLKMLKNKRKKELQAKKPLNDAK